MLLLQWELKLLLKAELLSLGIVQTPTKRQSQEVFLGAVNCKLRNMKSVYHYSDHLEIKDLQVLLDERLLHLHLAWSNNSPRATSSCRLLHPKKQL